jgi:FkbM family methyltransferase
LVLAVAGTVKSVVKRLIPSDARKAVREIRILSRVLPLHDALRVRRLMVQRGSTGHPGKVREVFVRPLGVSVSLRENTSDANVLRDTFIGLYHLPPREVSDPRTILDLGSNIGLTVAHYAVLFPRARILGIELDPETAALARRNVAAFGGRCEVLSGAAWVNDEPVWFERECGKEWAARVGEPTASSTSVQGYSVASLVERLGGSVDLMKMDIEGGEGPVLASNTDWARAIRSIKVEVHDGPRAVDECSRRLQLLGFAVRPDDRHWAGLIAVRA